MDSTHFFPRTLIDFGSIQLGSIKIDLILTDVVTTSWAAILILALLSWLMTRGLSVSQPKRPQLIAESVILAMAKQIKDFSQMPIERFFSLIATMWLFVGMSNLIGMTPFFSTPTRDISAVLGLTAITFFSIYYFGFKDQGIHFLKHYIEPVIFLLPLNIIGELGRILSLSFRLFGNMLGWELIIGILLLLAGLLIPVPMMLFNLVGNVIQAYLFGILTLVYIVSGLKTENYESKENEKWIQ